MFKTNIYTIKLITFIIIIQFTGIYNAHCQPYMEWASKYNDYIGNDYGNDISLDEEGNIYVTGITENSNLADYITIKYNPEGIKLWNQNFNGNANQVDESQAIEIDINGNIIVTGKSKSSNTGFDIVTIKYNPDGIQLWATVFNGSDSKDDIGYELISDVYGNIYVCGSANTEETVQQGIVLKYNSSGNLLWTKYLESGKSTDIVINSFGNIVVSSGNSISGKYKIYELAPLQGNQVFRYNSTNDVNTQIGGIPDKMICGQNGSIYVVSSAAVNSDQPEILRIAKYSHSIGTPVWTKDITAEWVRGGDLKLDNEQNLYVLADNKSNSQHKFHTLKFNSTGSLLWEKFSNPSSGINDFSVTMALSAENTQSGIYVAGYNSSGDIYTINYNSNGESVWTKLYNCYSCSSGPDVATAMIADRCGKIYLTGYSNCDGTAKDIRTIKYSVYQLPQIYVSGSNSICEGEEITLSIDPCEGCTYQWSNGQTSAEIVISPLESNSYTVTVTNIENCKTSSAPVLIYVNPPLTPIISITASKTSVCSGENVTFVATPVDGGIMPVYNWYVDGELKSTVNSRYFSSKTLVDRSKVFCIMTSTAQCPASLKDTSNVITMSVYQITQPGVSIEASASSVCAGQVVEFTAFPLNGGNSPAYEWFVDGVKQNFNSSIFKTSFFTNGSKVYATMSSNAGCVSQIKATSNIVSTDVKPLLNPTVNISVSDDTICEGNVVSFVALPFDCGINPGFKWYVNGQVQAQNYSAFHTGNIITGSEVYVEVIINDGCTSIPVVSSDKVYITVNSKVIPSVEIISSSNHVCEGAEVMITALPVNGGQSPSFKWYLNDQIQTEISGIFTSSNIADGSVIRCSMISNAECLNYAEALSNEIKMVINPVTNVSVSIETPSESVNECDLVTFFAIPVGNGPSSTFKWYVNGDFVAYGPVFSSDSLADGSRIFCTMSSYEECVFPSVAYSDTLSIIKNPLLKPEIFFSGDTISVENYNSSQCSYLWYFNGEAVSTHTFLLCSQFGSGAYYLIISNNGCIALSDTIYISCNSLNTNDNFDGKFSIYPNPASDIVYINYAGFRNSGLKIKILDMLGKSIMEDFLTGDEDEESYLNVSTLKDGAYILFVFDNENKKYRYHKLLIN